MSKIVKLITVFNPLYATKTIGEVGMARTGRPRKEIRLTNQLSVRVDGETYEVFGTLFPDQKRKLLAQCALAVKKADEYMEVETEKMRKQGYSEKEIEEERFRTITGLLQLAHMGQDISKMPLR